MTCSIFTVGKWVRQYFVCTVNLKLDLKLVESLEQDVMSGEVEKCPILHVRPKFDVFTLISVLAQLTWPFSFG